MLCGLQMYLCHSAGTLGRYGLLGLGTEGGAFSKRESWYDGRIDRRTIENELPAKEMICATFGTDVGDANRPSTVPVLIPSAG
jgi:hypothetical protein